MTWRIKHPPAELRYWRRIKFMPSGCWEWQGSLNGKGYGDWSVGGKHGLVTRWVYEKTFGPIPEGFVVMHVCDNPKCVRAAHLRTGTRLDNQRDMAAKGRWRNQNVEKTHCKRGHELTPANTVWGKHRGRDKRNCRTCRYAQQNERRRQTRRAA